MAPLRPPTTKAKSRAWEKSWALLSCLQNAFPSANPQQTEGATWLFQATICLSRGRTLSTERCCCRGAEGGQAEQLQHILEESRRIDALFQALRSLAELPTIEYAAGSGAKIVDVAGLIRRETEVQRPRETG
jgi:hypothetical protein